MIIAQDGHRITVEISARLIKEDGVLIAVPGIDRDISERKHLQEQFHTGLIKPEFRQVWDARSGGP